ncbi:unnamed protein product [Paramecium primaurelia]|uniref:MORN repeat protein n=1 Tax=Paramecium primaurelia TaxID=5886 RepID=A0A8S1QG51_PARPR|nr:unnamed protein product [Paramecium primaurelia]
MLECFSGGGLYDESNNGCKIGRWEEFDQISQITCQGNYNNGTKVGRWDIQWKLKSNSQKQDYQIFKMFSGGGSYDEGGNGMKNGNWIYLSEDFVDSYRQQKFIEVGEYKFGKKIGRWDIFYRGEELIQSTVFAGGSYDDEGNECKIGKWTELSDQYQDISQITYVGDYKNGKKVGRWDIWYHKNIREKKNDKIQYQRTLIGGGQFDEVGNQCKIGKWTELSYDFSDLYQVSYKGEYKIGKKIGLWETEYKGEQVGGGSYDEEGYVIKIGPWIELHDMFSDNCQIIYKGEYQQGKKVGSWLEMKRKAYQLDFKRGKVIKYDG